MRRHDLDLVSLLAGVLFVLAAAGFLVAAALDRTLDPQWLAPALLVAVGLAGVGGAVLGRK